MLQVHHLRGDYGGALECALAKSPAAAFEYVDAALGELGRTPLGAPQRLPAFKAALLAAMGRLVEVPNLFF